MNNASNITPLRTRRPRKFLPEAEDGLRLLANELREVLSRMSADLPGELTPADYARFGALWVRVTEAALKCEAHRALETERRAQRAREKNGPARGLEPEQLAGLERQLRLL